MLLGEPRAGLTEGWPAGAESRRGTSTGTKVGIAIDLGAVAAHAVAALLFFQLFRYVHSLAAGSLAAFGMMGAASMLIGVACSALALDIALDRTTTSAHDAHLLYRLNGSAWQVGGVFFGLWLIPMGWLVLRCGLMGPGCSAGCSSPAASATC